MCSIRDFPSRWSGHHNSSADHHKVAREIPACTSCCINITVTDSGTCVSRIKYIVHAISLGRHAHQSPFILLIIEIIHIVCIVLFFYLEKSIQVASTGILQLYHHAVLHSSTGVASNISTEKQPPITRLVLKK